MSMFETRISSSPEMSISHSLRCTGTFGEDGQLQQLLEERGVAYTGEGVEGSKLAFDKIRSKEKFEQHGVRTPAWETIDANQHPRMRPPIVIKAPRQGSTSGVHIVKNAEGIEPAIAGSAKYDRGIIDRKVCYLAGINDRYSRDQALPILEIIPKGGFYGFHQQVSFPQSSGGRRRGACLPGQDQ